MIPVSDMIAIATVGCDHCGVAAGEPCLGVYRRPMASGMHGNRRSKAQAWRWDHRELYQQLRTWIILQRETPEYGLAGC